MLNREKVQIGIIGLGLIGGSLARVLSNKGYQITGIAYSDTTFAKAKELDIFTKVSQSLDALCMCDVIFVATPINAINMTFNKLNSIVKTQCIITDVASIKGEIYDFGNKTFTNELITFIPGHPMAGTERKGLDYSFPELFDDCRWVICPTDPMKNKQINILSFILEDTGARIVYANPYDHDMAVAMISHMPLLVSMGLVETIESQENIVLKELACYLAASGYRDTTRIAGGNCELSYDMLKFNQKNVLKALDIFEESIKHLREMLNTDKETVLEKFENISKARQSMYSAEGKNIFKGISI